MALNFLLFKCANEPEQARPQIQFGAQTTKRARLKHFLPFYHLRAKQGATNCSQTSQF